LLLSFHGHCAVLWNVHVGMDTLILMHRSLV